VDSPERRQEELGIRARRKGIPKRTKKKRKKEEIE
jgi:hypothetical protein